MSAKKRTSLDAVFGTAVLPHAVSSNKRKGKTESKEPKRDPAVENPPQEQTEQPKRPSVKQHTAYLPLAVHEQLRTLAFEENRKMHDYLIEGLDRVFSDRGLPSIKDIS
ncbi:MAG: hypothetical protein P4L84_18835 [Isosphaeraceae bacterium]|nr:hypothetical protein [Isosphaeraceae bacterium]